MRHPGRSLRGRLSFCEIYDGPRRSSQGFSGSLWMRSESFLGSSAHPATMPGLWLRGLVSVVVVVVVAAVVVVVVVVVVLSSS